MAIIHCQTRPHEAGGTVALVTVDNSHRLNVLDGESAEELGRVFEALGGDETLRAAVLRGSGDRAFIGGADIRAMVELAPETAEAFIRNIHRACTAIRRLPVPVVARISGYCLGAGLEVAAACDIRISDDTGTFAMPEVRLGVPSVIEAALLPRLIGWGKTALLLYGGESISAAEALTWGFVERLVSPADLDAAVEALVDNIAVAGPRAIRRQKELLQEWERLPLDAAIERGVASFVGSHTTDEPRQMMQRFLDRRKR